MAYIAQRTRGSRTPTTVGFCVPVLLDHPPQNGRQKRADVVVDSIPRDLFDHHSLCACEILVLASQCLEKLEGSFPHVRQL